LKGALAEISWPFWSPEISSVDESPPSKLQVMELAQSKGESIQDGTSPHSKNDFSYRFNL
jgi:hypothetical protein